MNHKIDPNIRHPFDRAGQPDPHQGEHGGQSRDQVIFGHKLPQNSFRDFLKSKVHRPHVSEDFIQQLKSKIPKE